MLIKNKIPFVNENQLMKNALKVLNSKKLGFIVIINNQGLNSGIFTDGDLKRLLQKKGKIQNLKIKSFMTKNPLSIGENTPASKALDIMNRKEVTSLLVFAERKNFKKKSSKLKGILHIHSLLQYGIK